MTNKAEWGLRSMQDDPDSDSYGGQSVFDVYSKSRAPPWTAPSTQRGRSLKGRGFRSVAALKGLTID